MLAKKKILVGVTGGIAAYKVCGLVNTFIKEGAEVRVIMTKAAQKFVGPITFQALTNNKVYCNPWDLKEDAATKHIELAQWADVVLIAPATANTISKIACGLADNLLTTVLAAVPQQTKIVIAPAMNTNMWDNPLIQKNIEILKSFDDRYRFVEPREGVLVCRDVGKGKIAGNAEIFKIVEENCK